VGQVGTLTDHLYALRGGRNSPLTLADAQW
jgi:hypothetical protein